MHASPGYLISDKPYLFKESFKKTHWKKVEQIQPAVYESTDYLTIGQRPTFSTETLLVMMMRISRRMVRIPLYVIQRKYLYRVIILQKQHIVFTLVGRCYLINF